MGSTTVLNRPQAASTLSASPKVVKNNKSLASSSAAPLTYGCNHIEKPLQGPTEGNKMRVLYGSATRVALDSSRAHAQTCEKCKFLITRTFLCMQCPSIYCPKDAEAHYKEKNHRFGIDSRSGHVYCFPCQDFIYDPALEKIRVEKEVAMEGGARKRRRLDDIKPSPEDLKYIESNTTLAPCRATGLRGFLNMGSTCFMSVVLQSLIHNPLVRNFYLADGHKPKECAQANCMSCAMEEVFSEFFATDKTDGFGPVNLLTTSWKCEQTLAGYQQQDAHEYLQFLLNQLHATNGGNTDTKTEQCKCIIHRAFYGKLQSDVTCEGCQNVTTAVDPVMDLSLDLRKKDKRKLATPKTEGDGAMQTLQECLERFTSTEKLGMNEYNCGNCSGHQEVATKQLTVKRLPPVLCIQLKRFEHGSTKSSKIDTKIRFPMQLDMTPYTTRAKRKAKDGSTDCGPKSSLKGHGPYLYDLLSVVVHTGQINSGHYINFSRENGQGQKWFRFDDSVVTLATEKDVLSAKAYLLFYIIRSLS
ncbi:hypothetical protein HOY82DRAFT_621803 [Tuber indicum]|nr:hypothetical protein HOY82DRAFT_621803 [Tuber indicum]